MAAVFTADNLSYMMGGMKLTLEISALASVLAILLGTPFCADQNLLQGTARLPERDRNDICGDLPLYPRSFSGS